MAPPVGTLRVGRYFTALAVLFAILYAFVFLGSTQKPKLGLDLVGGIRVVFTALTPSGSPPPTSDQMTQARQILEDRINGTGVTGSTVVVQGSDQLVVEIPNGTGQDLVTLGKAAVLNFRGVVAPATAVTCANPVSPNGSSSNSPSSSAPTSPSGSGSTSTSASASSSAPAATDGASASRSPDSEREVPLAAPSNSATDSASTPASTPASTAVTTPASASPTTPVTTPATVPASTPATSSAASAVCLANPFENPKASAAIQGLKAQLISTYKITDKNADIWDVLPNAEQCPSPGIDDTDCRAYSALSATQTAMITAALQSLDCGSTQTEPDRATGAYFACDDGKTYGTKVAYLLGHVIVKGSQIDEASAQAPNTSGQGGNLQWTVNLKLTSGGGDKWFAWTSKFKTSDQNQSATSCSLTATPCSDFVGFTLDGEVISAPVTLAALDINTSISGNFTQSSANDLARQLNYGKLPVNFRADATQEVSATLGSKQLNAAFLAGGIGLVLVVLYSLIYYRALGIVTIASLLVSAGLTYAFLVILGKQLGFTLDLAGIAGFIVALGITADSFVVFFERLKDEVHEGRSARVAVPRAWVRARRTILSADTVSFLAAAILYYFAAADVKGFAFTLGMSTILDLVVVFLFTHPLVALLSRSARFGSSRMTGLDAVRGTRERIADPVPAKRGADAPQADPDRFRASAVLTKPATDVVTDEDPTPAESDDAVAEDQDAEEGEPSEVADTDEPAERRHTTPEPGSAAERAAARRQRLREQRDSQNGDS